MTTLFTQTRQQGFALPTVLIVSVILLMLLVTGMSAAVAVNNGLRDQYHTRLAELATDAGTAFANACYESNGNSITWSDTSPLRPNTDCNGTINTSLSAYVLDQGEVRTYFVVGDDMLSNGFTEAVRSTTNLAWRVWTSGSASALQIPVSTMPVGSIISLAWTSGATPPDGYLWASGQCVSRTTYPALFAKLGTTFDTDLVASYGWTACPGNEFRIPVTADRTLVSVGGTSNFNTVGKYTGEVNHTVTQNEMPSHTHTGTTGGQSADHAHYTGGTTSTNGYHEHNVEGPAGHSLATRFGGGGLTTTFSFSPDAINTNQGYGGRGFFAVGNGNHEHSWGNWSGGVNTNHTHNFTTNATGSGQPMNVVQPSTVIRMAIKY